MFMTIIVAILCFGIGYIVNLISMKFKNPAINELINSIKKGKPIVFLETDKGIYFTSIEKIYKNLAVTPRREVIIIPKSTLKPCLNLRGVPIAHGDLYKSVTTPQELRLTIKKLTGENWSQEEIAQFFDEISKIPPERLKSIYKLKKEAGKLSKLPISKLITEDEKGNKIPISELHAEALRMKQNKDDKDKLKYDIYVNLPSTVKDYIYTGLNRVSIHDMIREMVYQRELENIGKRDWIKIAIAILIILVGIGMAVKFIFGTGGITSFLSAATHTTRPPQINP